MIVLFMLFTHGESAVFWRCEQANGAIYDEWHIALSWGILPLNLPFKKKLQFNELMLPFYESGDERPMNQFMRSRVQEKTIQLME